MTPPCGVPVSVGEKKPTSTTPAFSQRRNVVVNTGNLASNGAMVNVVEGFDNLLPLSTTHSLTPQRS